MKTILRDTHLLDAAGVDNISAQIADVLSDYPYITHRDILRLRLSAEEILLHWMRNTASGKVQLIIEEKAIGWIYRWYWMARLFVCRPRRCRKSPVSAAWRALWQIWGSTGSTSLTMDKTAPTSPWRPRTVIACVM